MKGPLSILQQRFFPERAVVTGGPLNQILRRLMGALTFNDTQTIKWSYSEASGLRGDVIFPANVQIPCAYECTISPDLQLSIIPGTTSITDQEQRMFVPVVTELEGVPLDSEEPPTMDLSAKGSGSYEVWVRFEKEMSEVFLVNVDEPMMEPEPCEYFLKIFTFDIEGDMATNLEQVRCGHAEIVTTLCPSSSGNSDSSDDLIDDSSDSGDSKSTAIVPASWTEEGYAALYIAEMPDVRFDDVVDFINLKGRNTILKIDPRYLEVCEQSSLSVCGAVGDMPGGLGVSLEEGSIIIRKGIFNRSKNATIRITGKRKGFLKTRFEPRTKEQFKENEEFINSAYNK